MRRVSWPDEAGWWWVVDKKAAEKPTVRYFSSDEINNRELHFDPYKWAWANKFIKESVYEGPIPKPRIPMRFEIDDVVVTGRFCTDFASINRPYRILLDSKDGFPAEAAEKRFRVTFEEIL